jgi:protein-tyrosine phosphatase
VIDLHSHILPGVDDGAADLQDALSMAFFAAADGVETLVATPHASAERPRADLAARVADLQAALDAESLPLRVLTGAEIALSPGVPAKLADRLLPTLAGSRYALVELPFAVLPPHVDQVLFEMQLAGFTPVMAHVERYRYVQSSIERLQEWSARGVILQVNASSLRGDFGPRPREAAEAIVRRAWPAVLASDAHDTLRRRPELAFARALVAALAGDARAADLLDAGPAAILADRPFPAPTPRPPDPPSDTPGPLGRLIRRVLGR